ncbi:MAG: NADH-quinone oxidoreductase subunit C [Trueperaceae bacterium]|nr:NADH-quinone oxidoreductase subunit C [Trueperaceae bacterium]MCO5172557.1 NADH-quinone oxidoreductase subunit C [Trueperaceae bacterium]MCW5821115.1 NADH-quinone oxidoreductase subunit C [Trueperaceae bacterium]
MSDALLADSVPLGANRNAALVALAELGGVVREDKEMVNVTVPKARIVEALRACRAAGLEMLTDVFGIDYLTYPGHRGKRFVVVYNVHDVRGTDRLFVRVEVDDGESVPTATEVWRGADFLERETFDMLGIEFEGHPNLRKLLTPEDLDGHPHRKDFPLGETPTLFNDGRFLDPAAFRAGLTGRSQGLTGWMGGARRGVTSTEGTLPGDGRGKA